MWISILAILLLLVSIRLYAWALVILVLHLAIDRMKRRSRGVLFRMHHLSVDASNEALVLESLLSGRYMFFQIDSGYAGPPVLSSTYLASVAPFMDRSRKSTRVRYTNAIRDIQSVTDAMRNAAVTNFLLHSDCAAYTSGCTMRLMGIGSVVEQQADMMLCDMLRFESTDGRFLAPRQSQRARADVLVTNPLRGACHVLTSDYLFHVSPCCMFIKKRLFETSMSFVRLSHLLSQGFRQAPIRLSGGAILVNVVIAGESFACTMDTGAPGGICLGSGAHARLKKCRMQHASIRQRGVNGEVVCSELVTADATLHGHAVKDAILFLNDTPVEHSDGYVGLGFLRAFDILITTRFVAFRPSGLDILRRPQMKTTNTACNDAPKSHACK